MKKLISLIALFSLSIASLSAGEIYEETLPNDPRKVFTKSSPKWLEAVGKILIPNRDGKSIEQCSLTLVTDDLKKDSIIAVTAGHCLEDWINGGAYLTAPALITFTTQEEKKIERRVDEVLYISARAPDYAVVKLNKKILNSTIKPLLIAEDAFRDSFGTGYLQDDDFNGGPGHERAFGTIAGYSADTSPLYGNKGKNLTYDEDCYFNGGSKLLISTECYSYGGSSGGAAVVTVDQGDYNDYAGVEYLYVGSIVGGKVNSGNEVTYIAPVQVMKPALEEAFNKSTLAKVCICR
jgi:hypothetical protein